MKALKYFLLLSAVTSSVFSADAVKASDSTTTAQTKKKARTEKRGAAQAGGSVKVEYVVVDEETADANVAKGVVTVAKGVKVIEEMEYSDKCITELKLPNSLEEIKKGAFAGSYPTPLTGETKLLDLSHTNIHTIGESAFFNTNLLFSVVFLPSTLKIVARGAFSSGPKLIVIPASMDEELKKQLKAEYNKKDCARDAVTIIKATGQ